MQQLPSSLVHVTVPECFAPSQWQQLEACPLSVWAQAPGALPESAEVIIGRILHDVRERFVATKPTPNAPALSTILSNIVEAYEKRLRSNPTTASLAPIAEMFGRRKWVDAEARLRKWAAELPIQKATRPARNRQNNSSSAVGATLAFGEERTWYVPELRLRGRPDQAWIAADGCVEIVDYKSGNVVDRQGVHASIVTQLQLYALMAEHVTGRTVRLFVHGRQRIAIEWNDSEKAKIVVRVQSFSDTYPIGAVLPVTEGSEAGSHCVGCRLRAQCPRYLRDIPSWWPNTGEHPRPLSLDAWGVVSSSRRDSLGWTLHLDDPVGRSVEISGIADRHEVDSAATGRYVYGFGLAAGEDQFMHGRPLHPRAFHERSPSPRWRSAPCSTFYVR